MPYNINGEPLEDGNVVFGIIFGLFAAMLVAAALIGQGQPMAQQTHDALDATLTTDGTYIYWYVFTDPDTGCEYLVNDRGGCVPRFDDAGTPIQFGENSADIAEK